MPLTYPLACEALVINKAHTRKIIKDRIDNIRLELCRKEAFA